MLTIIKSEKRVQVWVFKTNIRFKKDLLLIAPLLDRTSAILNWNVDRSDVDKVLRIESLHLQAQEIIGLVQQAGYHCEELPD
jgi:hypothetical protein